MEGNDGSPRTLVRAAVQRNQRKSQFEMTGMTESLQEGKAAPRTTGRITLIVNSKANGAQSTTMKATKNPGENADAQSWTVHT